MQTGEKHIGLIVVDLQEDFFENGALPVQGARTLLPEIEAVIAAAGEAGWPVFLTRDWHPQNHASFRAQGGPWPDHCIAGSIGAAFHADLDMPPSAIIVSKGTSADGMGYSPFEDGEFLDTLKERYVTRVVVVGIALDYCVKATCLDACERGFDVVAVKDLIASVSQDATTIREHWQELESSGITVVADIKSIPVTETNARRRPMRSAALSPHGETKTWNPV